MLCELEEVRISQMKEYEAEEEEFIAFDHIHKKYGKELALRDVSFKIPRGSIFGIIGPNGAGKSTLLKILIGFLTPDSGDLRIFGKEVKKRTLQIQHLFGYASQKNCFYPELTVEENIAYFGRLYWLNSKEISRRRAELIQLTGLMGREGTQAKKLSGGMQRKLDIACAIIHQPHILVLDEPSAGIDTISAKQLLRILKRINDLGTTIIISSHDLEFLDDFCTHLVILDKGELVERGNPKKIKAKHTKEVIVSLITDPPVYDDLLQVLKEEQQPITGQLIEEGNLLLKTAHPEKVVVSLVKHVVEEHKEIIDLDIRQPTLTEIFERIIISDIEDAPTNFDDLKVAVKKELAREYLKITKMLKEKNVPEKTIHQILEAALK